MQHRAGAAPHANISGLQHLERHERRVQQVSQFMGEKSEPFGPACGFAIDARLIALTSVLGHRARDGIVQASVQRAEVVGADRCVHFHCEFGDGLTDIAIVMNHLRHGESLAQEIVSMLDRTPPDLRACDFAEAKRIPQLIEEHGDTVVDLRFSGRRNRPRGHLGPATPDDLIPIDSNEFVEHGTLDSPHGTA